MNVVFGGYRFSSLARTPLVGTQLSVSFRLMAGQTLGIAGESGSGKSTLAHAVASLTRPPGVITGGSISYQPHHADESGRESIDVLGLAGESRRLFRWEEISIAFQSALNSLNPVLSVRAQLIDTIRAHRPRMTRDEAEKRAAELLDEVGVARDRLTAYPHELSGGMRQRVMIAMALALNPNVLIMDEPTTALDVVTQRQILERIKMLQAQHNFAIIFITHDLNLLLEIADVIGVMYAGKLVEIAKTEEIYANPLHPYTRGLLASTPPLRGEMRTLTGIAGSPPDMRNLPIGCPFVDRCPEAIAICREKTPQLVELVEADSTSRAVACWLRGSSS